MSEEEEQGTGVGAAVDEEPVIVDLGLSRKQNKKKNKKNFPRKTREGEFSTRLYLFHCSN